MKFYVNGSGFIVETAVGPQLIARGTIYNAPADWTPIPDSWLLFPMDQQAQSALATSIAALIAAKPPHSISWPPPGITELNPNPPIFAP